MRITVSRPPIEENSAGSSQKLLTPVFRRSEFLTPTEVADRLLVAPVTVRLWANRGLLPSVSTPGGHRRFRIQDVEAFIVKRQRIQGASKSPPTRILIIDHDAQFTRYLSQLISLRARAVVLVETALDGFSAGIKCEAMRPDIVTLDLQMPYMNGLEVCRSLRATFGADRPRILAFSGFSSRANIKKILAAGANTFLSKKTPSNVLIRELGLDLVAAD